MTLLLLLRPHGATGFVITYTTDRLAFAPAAGVFATQPRAGVFDKPDPRSA